MSGGHIEGSDLRGIRRARIARGRDEPNCCDGYCKQEEFGASGHHAEAGTDYQDCSHRSRLGTDGCYGMWERHTRPMCAYAYALSPKATAKAREMGELRELISLSFGRCPGGRVEDSLATYSRQSSGNSASHARSLSYFPPSGGTEGG